MSEENKTPETSPEFDLESFAKDAAEKAAAIEAGAEAAAAKPKADAGSAEDGEVKPKRARKKVTKVEKPVEVKKD